MTRRTRFLALAVLAVLAGCDRSADTESSGAGAVPSPGLARGELLSYACIACHSLSSGGSHQVGPSLHGIFGRTAGTAGGFAYSDALERSGIVWTPAELDRWLADPAGFLPGTTMTFTGFNSAEDRSALIDYLVQATTDSNVAE